jgi:hypothetical protein
MYKVGAAEIHLASAHCPWDNEMVLVSRQYSKYYPFVLSASAGPGVWITRASPLFSPLSRDY